MTAAGEEIEGGDILVVDGRIAGVGLNLDAPPDATVIDAAGRYVTPGIIDTHSHYGVYASPSVRAHSDGNEATNPNTAEVWAAHSIWPQDPGFSRALAGGVTTAQILPGSANLIGGRSAIVKMVPARTVQDMLFPDAPFGLKMACGENPKRVYGSRPGGPSTRMGNVAGYRQAFVAAEDYRQKWDNWIAGGMEGEAPDRDLELETLAEVLRGNILIQNHCYRADDMLTMINLGQEFGFTVRSFHHAVEAYKIRDYLARDTIAASMWVDWWGFKMEAFDAIAENIALVSSAGARAILHTDSGLEIQIMNQNAARAMYAGRRAGLEVSRDEALRWITANPAWALGLDDVIGTLDVGKNADFVIWSGDPFSVYTRADQVFIDGALIFDREDPNLQPTSDFELGILPPSAYRDGGDR
jgi:imidazolonepropionase-like amidohydrolase